MEAIDKLGYIFNEKDNIVAQKRFLQSIIERIIITGNKIEIHYWLNNK